MPTVLSASPPARLSPQPARRSIRQRIGPGRPPAENPCIKGVSKDLHMFRKGSGAAEGTRTPDPIITNDVLYQLSYSGLVAGY